MLAHQQSDGGVVLSNSSNSVVKNSDLRYNPSGVDASGTNNLVVENNDVSNSLQSGIELGDGVNMVIRNNIANRTGGAGISVDAGAFDALGNAVGGALIEGNTANENAESGIAVAVAKHTIRNNTANNNSNYGIDAGEEPVQGEPLDPNRNIDGGGNRAIGNHSDGVTPGLPDAVQCLGVVCAAGDPAPMTPADLAAPADDAHLGAPRRDRERDGGLRVHRQRRPERRPADRDDLRVPPRRAGGPAGASGGARARAARPEPSRPSCPSPRRASSGRSARARRPT